MLRSGTLKSPFKIKDFNLTYPIKIICKYILFYTPFKKPGKNFD